jgi:hypothetical protein
VNAVIDTAPANLNTLNELAAALGDDANYAATTTTALGNRYTKAETDVKIVELSPPTDISGKLDKTGGTISGNLSIGTSNSANTLHVQKDVDDFVAKIENDGDSNSSDGLWIDTRWNTSSNTLLKVTTNSGTQDVMRIAGDGNVGIGTASPSQKLVVYSDATDDGILVDVLSKPRIILRDRVNSDTVIGTGKYGLDDLYIDTYSGNALAIDGATRRVGIGTTSPVAKLDVKSQINLTNSDNASLQAIKGTRFGYASSYKVVQVGDTSGTNNIALGVDLSTNPSGSFSGYGGTIYVRNDTTIGSPNSTNDGYHSYMRLKDGFVTTPNQPAFRVGMTNGVNTTTGTNPIPWDNDGIGNCFVRGGVTLSGAGRVTVPVAGIYSFQVKLRSESTPFGYVDLNINKNGASVARIYHNTSPWNVYQEASVVSIIVHMSANDYVETKLGTGTTSSSISGSANGVCWFMGHLIG